ncbi:chemotaxis protein CheW [Pseudomonas sediminis]|uniref:Chemotaxis protein CheW n=1 Tax=Pseudomonas sediminis TaxID=1691904 RepID=A0A2G5FH07_9PSED|nr:chemotaxis protein CheW [Pseudomonas sediminis]PIA67257.1 chemotaxis protein CheW [Pseudomonas sediminis]
MNEAALETEKSTQQYLTFVLSGENYAVDSLSVREILEYTRFTPVPRMPATVRGAINLRGSVVPVIDLQARFGGSRTELNKRTCIIILDVPDEDRQQSLGVLVDAVSAVREIDPEEIQPAPAFGSHLRSEFITGVVRMGERFITLLALDQVLDLEALGKSANSEGS